MRNDVDTLPVGIHADFLRLISLMEQHDADLRLARKRAKEVAHAMRRPGFKAAWDALEQETTTLAALLEARHAIGADAGATSAIDCGLRAARMGPTKSAISRPESSLRSDKGSPSFATLRKYAHACGRRLVVRMV